VRQCLEMVVGGRNCVITVQHTLEKWLEEGCREAVKPDEGLDDKVEWARRRLKEGIFCHTRGTECVALRWSMLSCQ